MIYNTGMFYATNCQLSFVFLCFFFIDGTMPNKSFGDDHRDLEGERGGERGRDHRSSEDQLDRRQQTLDYN